MAKLQINMISYVLQRTVDVTVVLPSVTIPESMLEKDPHHDYSKKYPVLYLLHGYGNNNQTWTGYSNVELYAEERQIAVVMFGAENKFYCNQPMDKFYDFLNKELPEYITQVFPISTRKEDTYIAGLSMGGFGALYHGLSNPERFAAIGAFSAGLKLDGRPDCKKLCDKILEEKKEFPKMFISIGGNDFLLQNNIDFHEYLVEKEIEHTWQIVPGYEHEWRFWDLKVEEFLDWIERSDAYANKKRKV